MSDRPKNDDLDQPLLGDDELVALIEGRYKQAGEPVDETARERSWRALQQKTGSPAAGRPRRRLWTYATVAAAAAVAVLLWTRRVPDDSLSVKGGGQGSPVAGMSLIHENGGRREPLADGAHVKAGSGRILLLPTSKLPSSVHALAALAGSETAAAPTEVASAAALPPDPAQPVVSVAVPPTAGAFKLCIITAESAEALAAKVDVMRQYWSSVAGDNCVRLTVE